MSDVIALFVTDYFLIGVRFGLLAVGVGWGLRWVFSKETRPLPLVGLFIAVGTLLTLQMVEGALDRAIIPSIVTMAVGVGAAQLLGAPRRIYPLSAFPGALLLAIGTTVTEFTWVRVMFALLIPVAGYLLTDFELRHEGLGLGVIYFNLAILGVFGAIPDTEWAVAIVAVAFPLTFLGWPKVAASIGPMGGYLAVAVLLWVAAHGGDPRPASIIGSAACLGLLLLEPIIIAINPRAMRVSRWVRHNWLGALVASIPQFMLILICSRVAARFTNPFPALVVVAFAYGAVLVVGLQAGSPLSESDEEVA